MRVKIFDKVYEVEKTIYCDEEKGTYYYLKGKKTPYCDLDYDIEIIELTPLEALNEFLDIIEVPVKSHLLNSNDKTTLERYRVLRTRIETALKRLEQLEEEKQSFDRVIEKKLKAFEIIKEKRVDITFFDTYVKWNWEKYLNRKLKCSEKELTQAEFDLLKEVFENEH